MLRYRAAPTSFFPETCGARYDVRFGSFQTIQNLTRGRPSNAPL